MDSRNHSKTNSLQLQKPPKAKRQQIEQRNTVKFDNQTKKSRERSASLKDLCPEDKAKIGELVKKLAEEKALRGKIEKESQQERMMLEEEYRQIKAQNEQMIKEGEKLRAEFDRSLMFIKELKQNSRQKVQLQLWKDEQICFTPKQETKQVFDTPKFDDCVPLNIHIDQENPWKNNDWYGEISDFSSRSSLLTQNNPKDLKPTESPTLSIDNSGGAMNEIKCLRQELCTLSTSIKSLNASASNFSNSRRLSPVKENFQQLPLQQPIRFQESSQKLWNSTLPIEEEDLDLDDDVYDPGLLDLINDIESSHF